jgi:hypothetical protein
MKVIRNNIFVALLLLMLAATALASVLTVITVQAEAQVH